jgi:hypothetical protein
MWNHGALHGGEDFRVDFRRARKEKTPKVDSRNSRRFSGQDVPSPTLAQS